MFPSVVATCSWLVVVSLSSAHHASRCCRRRHGEGGAAVLLRHRVRFVIVFVSSSSSCSFRCRRFRLVVVVVVVVFDSSLSYPLSRLIVNWCLSFQKRVIVCSDEQPCCRLVLAAAVTAPSAERGGRATARDQGMLGRSLITSATAHSLTSTQAAPLYSQH